MRRQAAAVTPWVARDPVRKRRGQSSAETASGGCKMGAVERRVRCLTLTHTRSLLHSSCFPVDFASKILFMSNGRSLVLRPQDAEWPVLRSSPQARG